MGGTRSRRSRKNTSRYNMRGCSKRHFFAKGGPSMHGKFQSKKCKCACHLDKHHKPECKCNCHQMNKVFGGRRRVTRGGDALNLSLAYTGKLDPLSPSPYGAYVGKGGSHTLGHSNVENAYPIISDTGGNTGWPNPSQTIRGGGCGCGKGGGRGHIGGSSYANGLVGSAWSSSPETWPGVNGVGGGSNHLSLNTYNNDISRQMLDIGANSPFNGMKGGRSRGRGRSRSRSRSRGRNLRGGNLLPQNLVNVGRSFIHNIGAGNNTMNGYAQPVSPMPYENQLVSNNSKFLNL